MDKNNKISLNEAIETFSSIMRSLNVTDQQLFLTFVADNWKPQEIKVQSSQETRSMKICKEESRTDNLKEQKLNFIRQIAMDIRNRVPFDCVLQSENIMSPMIGENSHCDDKSTKHVDAFLYNDSELVELIEEGQFQNLYCVDCRSNKIEEYNIISHSLSVSAIVYIFQNLLPDLDGKILLDIGSRLGAVLYGAHVFTSARQIIGVEMNKEFCTLQREMIKKYNMEHRIEIVNKKIEDCACIVQKSEIIVMNNPFEFYVPKSVHEEIWKFLKTNVHSGTYLICRPPIHVTFKHLKTGISLKDWVKPYQLERREIFRTFGSLDLDLDQHADIKCYRVV